MKKITILLTLIFAVPIFASAREAKLVIMSGTVEVKISMDKDWAPAVKGMDVPEGGQVRTGTDGRAFILLPNRSMIWLKKSSHIEFEQRQTLASRIAFFFGKMKARIPHLKRRERFEIRTRTAVCAVRGTELAMTADEEGGMGLEVLYGEVKLNYVVPPERGRAHVSIPQGHSLKIAEKGKAGKMALLTKEQETNALENWNPGLSKEQRQAAMKQKEEDRHEMKRFAAKTGETEQMVSNMTVQVKESDIEAGRTLKDIHGNLVRVDQRLIRPNSSTLQFVNLVKRPVYNHRRGKFAYSGPQGISRLDSLQARIEFNMGLPHNLAEWPGFFSSNEDSIHPLWSSLVMANHTGTGIFVIAHLSKYDPVKDDMTDDAWTLNNDDELTIVGGKIDQAYYTDPVIFTGNVDDMNQLNMLASGNIKGQDGGVVTNSAGTHQLGEEKFFNPADRLKWAIEEPWDGLRDSYDREGDDHPDLYNWEATPFCIGGKCGVTENKIWIAMENYVINNDGKVRTVKDFIETTSDPFSLLKDSAGEIIWYVKKDSGKMVDNTVTGDRYAGKRNIDLVIIPDLALAALQRMISVLEEIGD